MLSFVRFSHFSNFRRNLPELCGVFLAIFFFFRFVFVCSNSLGFERSEYISFSLKIVRGRAAVTRISQKTFVVHEEKC